MNRHGAIDLPFADGMYTFRLGLDEIEELERSRDTGIFAICTRVVPESRQYRVADGIEVMRTGLIGGGTRAADAADLVGRYVEQRPVVESVGVAYAVVMAALMRLHSNEPEVTPDAKADGESDRLDFGAIYGNAALMNVQNVGSLSIGQWAAICRKWNREHGGAHTQPPSEAEFEAAIIAARQ